MTRILTAVFLMAVVTYIPRVLPFIMLKSRLKSRFIRSFLYYVPFAVLGAMIFPNILFSTGNILSSIIGMGVALILAYLGKGLMEVAVCSILAVYICNLWLK